MLDKSKKNKLDGTKQKEILKKENMNKNIEEDVNEMKDVEEPVVQKKKVGRKPKLQPIKKVIVDDEAVGK